MRYVARRRNRQPDDNPTWPGLVDVFAFGMALMVVLFAVTSGSLRAQVQDKDDKIKELQDYSGMRIREIHDNLRRLDPSMADTWQLDPKANVIHVVSIGGRPITFESAQWTIAREDSLRLQNVVTRIAQEMDSFPDAVLSINGTADPRRLLSKGCLSDNIELSAMRAAAVARVLNANPHQIDKSRIRVVGLGEEGQKIIGLSPADEDSAYQQYRAVRMDIYVDASRKPSGAGRE